MAVAGARVSSSSAIQASTCSRASPAVVVGMPRASRKATNCRALRRYLSSVAGERPPARRCSSHPRTVEARSKLPAVILAAPVLPAIATSWFEHSFDGDALFLRCATGQRPVRRVKLQVTRHFAGL